MAGLKELLALATRDPGHLPERLLLAAQPRIARQVAGWAVGKQDDVVGHAWKQRHDMIRMARGEGAVAGTPFLIALVPAYAAFLEQEARFFLRLAALHGDDPASRHAAADILVIRGVHPDRQAALASLDWVDAHPIAPEKSERRGFGEAVEDWYRAVMGVLVFAGFVGPPDRGERARQNLAGRIRWLASMAAAGLIWAATFVFPVTFMMVMSWSCESDARRFTAAGLQHYGLEPETRAARKMRRAEMSRRDRLSSAVHATLLFISVAIPLFLMSASIANKRWTLHLDITDWVASLVGLALAIGLAVWAYRSGREKPDGE